MTTLPDPPRPKLATIRKLFHEHIAVQASAHDTTRVRDLGSEEALVRDYSGRVVFELLQNALDRAERKIVVALVAGREGDMLVVGNDGAPVTAHALPSAAVDAGKRSDLHSLLSLHSSTKSARSSVGNKGVGFRSVFGSGREVQVWSRSDEGPWWGLLMRHPDRWTHGAPAHAAWSEDAVASFYGARLEENDSDVALAASIGLPDEILAVVGELNTVVVLPAVGDRSQDPAARNAIVREVRESIERLCKLPLTFLDERSRDASGLEIELRTETQVVRKTLAAPSGAVEVRGDQVAMTDAVRESTGLDLPVASVRLLLPTEGSGTGDALFWSYLPTEQRSGHGVHVHADFYLQNSRRAVSFASVDGDAPGAHNRRLLESAADAIVHRLWTNDAVLRRDDFWQLARPTNCESPELRWAVARRLLVRDVFVELLRAAWRSDGARRWPLGRYRDFFDTLQEWTKIAYERRLSLPDGSASGLGKWRKQLLDWASASRAGVLPIVTAGADDASRVEQARPLRGAEETIYLAKEAATLLPEAIALQGAWVTAFEPPGLADHSEAGMTSFLRPELLAHLRPADPANANECARLLTAALQVASEAAERGRAESVLDRARDLGGGPFWGLRHSEGANAKSDLTRAAERLRTMLVPTTDGRWLPAYETTLLPLTHDGAHADDWPWPMVDAEAMNRLLPSIPDAAATGEAVRMTLADACTVLGISRGPRIEEQKGKLLIGEWDVIAGAPEARRKLVAQATIAGWRDHVGAVLRAFREVPARIEKLLESLEGTAWIPGDLPPTMIGGRLELVGAAGGWISPHRLWLQSSRGGFQRTGLLSRLVLGEGRDAPEWLRDLAVDEISETTRPDRVRDALYDLEMTVDPAAGNARELGDLYARLIRCHSDRENDAPLSLPVLVRRQGAGGRMEGVGWRSKGERVWFDNGDSTGVLGAFENVATWTVRRSHGGLANRLDIKTFAPTGDPANGAPGSPTTASELRALLERALPDMIALLRVARLGRDFEAVDEAQLLTRWATLRIQHWDHVNMHYAFDGLSAVVGAKDKGNVFCIAPPSGRAPELWFDGSAEQVVAQAAAPLALALGGDRAYAPLFEAVLGRWSSALGDSATTPAAVTSLRRDYSITDAEVDECRARVRAAVLDEAGRADWSARVRHALGGFGDPAARIEPGEPITRDAWTSVHSPTDETAVREAMGAAFVGALEAIARLQPTVEILSANRLALAARYRDGGANEAIASAAIGLPHDAWTEGRFDDLRARVAAAGGDLELAMLAKLPCDLDAVLRRRVGVGDRPACTPEEWARAQAFAEGKIELRSFPPATTEPCALVVRSAPVRTRPIATPSADEFQEQARRNATGGARAEQAILERAIETALAWLGRDAEGFWDAVRKALLDPLAEGDRRLPATEIAKALAASDSVGGLRRLLHVAEWYVNAGFDVLVPDSTNGPAPRLALVEAKRVQSLDNPSFYLSEGERRRAREYLDNGHDWRLWLVSPQGESRNATSVLEQFEKVSADIRRVQEHGILPGEYMVELAPPSGCESDARPNGDP